MFENMDNKFRRDVTLSCTAIFSAAAFGAYQGGLGGALVLGSIATAITVGPTVFLNDRRLAKQEPNF